MTRVIIDAEMQAKLSGLQGPLEFCDESGHTLGYFHPARPSSQDAKARSPFTDEEIEELRQQRCGRPLAEILKELGAS